MKRFLFLLGILSCLSLEARALKLYLISDHSNTEDHNQALEILEAFTNLSGQKNIFEDLNTNSINSQEIKKKIEQDLIQEKVIIVGAGRGGIEGIKDLSPNPSLIISLASRIALGEYTDPKLLQKVNFIAFPPPVPPEIKATLGPKLIETKVVTSAEAAENAYATWGQQILPTCASYVGVVIAGNTQMSQTEAKLFSEEDASKLANYISQNHIGACVLVLNGLQTEVQSPGTQGNLNAQQQEYTNHITEVFQNKLLANGQKDIKVINPSHPSPQGDEKTPPYSPLSVVTGAVKATNGKMVVPGQSLSVVSEAITALPPGKVLVYLNSAMSKEHEKQVAQELAIGKISVLQNFREIQHPTTPPPPSPHLSSSVIIAQKLLEATNF